MDFNPFGTHSHYHHYNHMIDTRESIWRELEKERIREEILAEELQRRRFLELPVRSELKSIEYEHEMVVGKLGFSTPPQPLFSHRYQFLQPEMVVPEWRYDDGRYRRDNGDFGGVQSRWCSEIETVVVEKKKLLNDDKKEMIGLGLPSVGSKRKPQPPSKKGDYSCKVCNIGVTSARGLEEHLSGKKHLAKLKSRNKKIKKEGRKKSKNRKKHKKPC